MSKLLGVRHYSPCTECGKAHTNPFFSALCTPCEVQRRVCKTSDVIDKLRGSGNMSTTEATNFLRAFRICTESI
jgi:hypothetical protein